MKVRDISEIQMEQKFRKFEYIGVLLGEGDQRSRGNVIKDHSTSYTATVICRGVEICRL